MRAATLSDSASSSVRNVAKQESPLVQLEDELQHHAR